jgi:hypothetical protein
MLLGSPGRLCQEPSWLENIELRTEKGTKRENHLHPDDGVADADERAKLFSALGDRKRGFFVDPPGYECGDPAPSSG